MITTAGENMKEMKLHRRDSLIITTIDIINELGIQGLSTREIAKRENISEATLFRHYKNKNDLLLSVLDYYSKFDEELFRSVELLQLSPRKSIEYYFMAITGYYENYPAIISVMHLFEVFRYEQFLSDKVKEILVKRFDFVRKQIMKAKNTGELLYETKIDELTDVISGIIQEISLRWRISDATLPLKKHTISCLDLILNATFKNDER